MSEENKKEEKLVNYRVVSEKFVCCGIVMPKEEVFNKETFTKGKSFGQTKKRPIVDTIGFDGIIKRAVSAGKIKVTTEDLTVTKEASDEDLKHEPPATENAAEKKKRLAAEKEAAKGNGNPLQGAS